MFANRSILGSDAEMLTTHADCSWACLKSFADDSSCASGRVLSFLPVCPGMQFTVYVVVSI